MASLARLIPRRTDKFLKEIYCLLTVGDRVGYNEAHSIAIIFEWYCMASLCH